MALKHGQFLEGKRIMVIGGGIAALAFVATLNDLWDPSLKRPEVIVCDRQSREISLQPDPFVLTLNGGSHDEGLAALQQLGLLEDVCLCSTSSSGAIMVWSSNWKYLASIKPKAHSTFPAAAMRITRENLKRILLQKAENANITWKWACTCTGAERLSSGKIRVNTSGAEAGSVETQDCDLLVAADGSESKIRANFRPQDTLLKYAGATQIGGISFISNGIPPPVHEDYGLQMSSGEGVCCIYTPFDKQTVGWALSRMGPEREAKTGLFGHEELAALKAEALEIGSMFNEPFKTIVEATIPEAAFIRPAMEKLPFQHSSNLQGVAFIGDANHVLSPYVLVGANLALKDGWDLAEQLCSTSSLQLAMAAYDKLSIPRTTDIMKFSNERIGFGHSTGLKWKVYKYGMAAQRAIAKE